MDPLRPPTEEEAFVGQVSSALDDIKELVAKTQTDKYETQAKELLAEYDAVDLVAALLNNMTKDDASSVPVKITPERPLPRRKNSSTGKYKRYGSRRNNNKRDRSKNYRDNKKKRRNESRERFTKKKSERTFTIRTKD